MKRIFLLTLMLLFVFNNFYGQAKIQSEITISMAKKITYYCRYNKEAFFLFAGANSDIVQYRSDIGYRLLENLDKNLNCAENFVIKLYYIFGVEKSYFVLKDAGFSIQEIEKAEDIWRKEVKKNNILAEKKKKEKEEPLLKRIVANDVFTKEFLSVQPDIEIDISNMATYTVILDKDEYLNYDYNCIISKDGKISLENPSDTLNYSATQKFIYQYISNENIGGGIYKAGCIEIGGKNISVNSYVNIKFNEQRSMHQGYLDLTIKNNMATGLWDISLNNPTDLLHWTCDEPEQLKFDLENAISTYNCPKLQEMKGEMLLKIYVYKRVLSSNISDNSELSHYFEMSYKNESSDGYGEYIPLEYQVSF